MISSNPRAALPAGAASAAGASASADFYSEVHRIEGQWTRTRNGARVMRYWLVEGRKAA